MLDVFFILYLCLNRRSRSQIFFKIGVLKNFANFTGKHRFGVRPATVLKRDSSTGVFLWNLRNFSIALFYKTLPVTVPVCTSIFTLTCLYLFTLTCLYLFTLTYLYLRSFHNIIWTDECRNYIRECRDYDKIF